MSHWIMIDPDVETVEEDKDLPDAGDTPDEVTAISIRCIFSCILSNSCCSSVWLYVPSTLRVDENWSNFSFSAVRSVTIDFQIC